MNTNSTTGEDSAREARSLADLRRTIEEKPTTMVDDPDVEHRCAIVQQLVEKIWHVVISERLDPGMFTEWFWPNDNFQPESFKRLAKRGTTEQRRMRILTFGQKFLDHFLEILDELKSYNRSATPVRNASRVSASLEPTLTTRTRSRSESNVGMDTLEVPILVSGLSKSLTDLQIVHQDLLEENRKLKDEVAVFRSSAKTKQDVTTKMINQQREIDLLRARIRFLEKEKSSKN